MWLASSSSRHRASVVAGLIGLAGLVSAALAQGEYLPDAPLVPTIFTEMKEPAGAACLPALHPPAPNIIGTRSPTGT